MILVHDAKGMEVLGKSSINPSSAAWDIMPVDGANGMVVLGNSSITPSSAVWDMIPVEGMGVSGNSSVIIPMKVYLELPTTIPIPIMQTGSMSLQT